jgi:hypothetical protein
VLASAESARFRVYDLVEDAPPKNFHEAAERGDTNYIVKAIERTIDFDINLTVSFGASVQAPAHGCYSLVESASK